MNEVIRYQIKDKGKKTAKEKNSQLWGLSA